jgi:CheY-like chemotaxis protein
MASLSADFRDGTALVVDGNPVSRSILVSQLRDLGLRQVSQASRIADGRRHLEFRSFDVVVCEQIFPNDNATGQDLLDDLRRSGLLPFGTIFVMVTGEASYSKVAEAAESALDSYLLKPYTAAQLDKRLMLSRRRKASLQAIFQAIENQAFADAARLCMERFQQKGEYWLYAARVGAELLLRLEQYDGAQRMYQAVIEAKTVPWARLGVARVQLESGQVQQASSTLDGLISAEPGYADAYDVMGRAQIELGQFDSALASYRMAAEMTPSSIGRLQRLGMLAHYCGDPVLAEDMLARAVRLGLDSKMFDAQSLVLLAFMRLQNKDRKGLQRCMDDVRGMSDRHDKSLRLRRLVQVVEVLLQLMDHQTARVLELVRAMMGTVGEDSFDFEAACNLLTLVSLLAQMAIQIDEVDQSVQRIGMRFCTSRALTELLTKSAAAHPPYAQRLEETLGTVLHMIEQAMRQSLAGNPRAAVLELRDDALRTQNAKVIESAWGVLKRYEDRIEDAPALGVEVQALRLRYASFASRPVIGDKNMRQSGGVSLRVMDIPDHEPPPQP